LPETGRSKILLAVTGFAILESILRLLFFYLGTYGGVQLVTPSPPVPIMDFINVFSLILGIAGLVVIPSLLFFRSWAYWGTIALCVLTIGFDGWAVLTTAWTAAAGVVIPALLLAYIAPKQHKFLHRAI
jgi:hypothetical protein